MRYLLTIVGLLLPGGCESLPESQGVEVADWRRGDGLCHVHNRRMETREVNGLAGEIHFSRDYHEARDRLFPNAGIEYGPHLYSETRGLIYLCVECEAAREDWTTAASRAVSEAD